VSITTVSHVLNRPDRVGASTRERVLNVMDELGFTPKPTAVTLARKGVGRIGVLAPFISYSSTALSPNQHVNLTPALIARATT
jgi:LacI family transcriptional regulator